MDVLETVKETLEIAALNRMANRETAEEVLAVYLNKAAEEVSVEDLDSYSIDQLLSLHAFLVGRAFEPVYATDSIGGITHLCYDKERPAAERDFYERLYGAARNLWPENLPEITWRKATEEDIVDGEPLRSLRVPEYALTT